MASGTRRPSALFLASPQAQTQHSSMAARMAMHSGGGVLNTKELSRAYTVSWGAWAPCVSQPQHSQLLPCLPQTCTTQGGGACSCACS